MGYIGNAPSQGLFNGSQIVDGTVDTVDLKDSAVTASKLSSTAIKDKLAADQFLAVPRGTTAQRPVSPEIGYTRYNTDTGALENYTVNGWLKVSIPTPVINSISGNIYNSLNSTLTLSGFNFGTGQGKIRFSIGVNAYDVLITPTSDSSASVSVPSSVYNLSADTVVSIVLINFDGGASSPIVKSIIGVPTGGTISVNNGYRVHTFLSSSNLIVPSNFVSNTEYLVVAGGGGGGGGRHSSGAGAGGLLTNLNGSPLSLSAGTYSIVIGAGGAAGLNNTTAATNGSNSSALSITTIGGGKGGGHPDSPNSEQGGSGGSGGGSAHTVGLLPGNGTAGQGYAGSRSVPNRSTCPSGGGAGGAGVASGSYSEDASVGYGDAGGPGRQVNIDGNNYYYAGGGGGSASPNDGTGDTWYGGAGGIGGGGGGASNAQYGAGGVGGGSARNSGSAGYLTMGNGSCHGGSGGANTGGGGGGAAGWASVGNGNGGNGGSGIVIIRYPLPT